MKADHNMYVIQNVTDVDKMREEAHDHSVPNRYTEDTESTIIHWHKFDTPCPGLDGPICHEVFGALDG